MNFSLWSSLASVNGQSMQILRIFTNNILLNIFLDTPSIIHLARNKLFSLLHIISIFLYNSIYSTLEDIVGS